MRNYKKHLMVFGFALLLFGFPLTTKSAPLTSTVDHKVVFHFHGNFVAHYMDQAYLRLYMEAYVDLMNRILVANGIQRNLIIDETSIIAYKANFPRGIRNSDTGNAPTGANGMGYEIHFYFDTEHGDTIDRQVDADGNVLLFDVNYRTILVFNNYQDNQDIRENLQAQMLSLMSALGLAFGGVDFQYRQNKERSDLSGTQPTLDINFTANKENDPLYSRKLDLLNSPIFYDRSELLAEDITYGEFIQMLRFSSLNQRYMNDDCWNCVVDLGVANLSDVRVKVIDEQNKLMTGKEVSIYKQGISSFELMATATVDDNGEVSIDLSDSIQDIHHDYILVKVDGGETHTSNGIWFDYFELVEAKVVDGKDTADFTMDIVSFLELRRQELLRQIRELEEAKSDELFALFYEYYEAYKAARDRKLSDEVALAENVANAREKNEYWTQYRRDRVQSKLDRLGEAYEEQAAIDFAAIQKIYDDQEALISSNEARIQRSIDSRYNVSVQAALDRYLYYREKVEGKYNPQIEALRAELAEVVRQLSL